MQQMSPTSQGSIVIKKLYANWNGGIFFSQNEAEPSHSNRQKIHMTKGSKQGEESFSNLGLGKDNSGFQPLH